MQKAAKEFVDVLPERINLGLVTFAGTATTLVPPTTDRDQVRGAIDNLELAESTAIGEAIFTSLTAIQNFQATLEDAGEEAPPARVVLLSDGYPTVGRDETQAIAAAKRRRRSRSRRSRSAPTTARSTWTARRVPVPVDRATLERIADETGGSYSEAASAEELEEVYADLGSQIGYTTEPQDISPRFVRVGVLVLIVGAVLSLLWTNRLV